MAKRSEYPATLFLRNYRSGQHLNGQSHGGRRQIQPLESNRLILHLGATAIMKALSKSKRVLIHGFVLALAVNLTMWLPGARAASNPTDDIKGLIQEVQAICQSNSAKSQRLELVEKVTAKHLNFREMAKRCLPSTWSKLNRSQQDEFVKVFSGLLKASYANHLDEFAKTKVDYQGETNKCDGCEVRIVVLRPNDKIPVNFRLMQEPQGWMIYDMVIEGVSLVDNFRNQFSAMIQEFSYNELVSRLKERLAAERHG
jgi:phospholipid transport system substrate-binding protein